MSDDDLRHYPYVTSVLAELRAQALAQLHSATTRDEWLRKKLEIDRALAALSQASHLGLTGREQSWVLPACRTRTPSSEYRVLEDNETDRREHWTDVVIAGAPLRLQPGDVVLRRK